MKAMMAIMEYINMIVIMITMALIHWFLKVVYIFFYCILFKI